MIPPWLPVSETPRKGVVYALQNGVGTLITRVIVICLPFLFSGAVWAGKTIVELNAEKVMDAIGRVEKRLDKMDDRTEALDSRIVDLDKRVTRNEDHINDARRDR